MSHAVLLAALLIAGQGQTQTSPAARPGSNITRSLNSAPPSAVIVAPSAATSPPPAAVRPTPTPTPVTVPAPTPIAPVAGSARPEAAPVRPTPSPSPYSAPYVAPRPTTVPAPVSPAWRLAAPASSPPPVARPAPTPAPIPAPAATAPVATNTVLDAPAIAALPFSVQLPAGLTITTGRPGPDFDIWTIRRGQQPLVMVYAGPASQFPIYSGEMVDAGGRASVVATENGRRVALEHLFTRQGAPHEIHVWITSVDGADRTLAEQIGQSIDVR